MYRSASRYDSRSIPEKSSRSGRSAWMDSQNRPYGAPLEEDDRGLSRDPYLTEDAHFMDRGFQQHKVGSSSNDLREAQRLAASFFSQYPASSPADTSHAYRDPARSTRPLSPEAPIDRYSSRGQYRERESGVERWSDRSNPDPVYSSRSQILSDEWENERVPGDRRERIDVFGARGRKREEVGWDAVDYDYGVARKESDYGAVQRGDPDASLRITKRVDWTGLLRPDPNRADDTVGLDSSSLSKRASQNYRGGRPYVDSFRSGFEEDLDPEDTLYTRRGGAYYGERYREPDLRKESTFLVDRPLEREYGLNRGGGTRGGGRGSRGREEWRAERELSAGRGMRLSDSDRGRDKGRYEERDSSRRPFYSTSSRQAGGGGGSGVIRERNLVDDNPVFHKGRGGKYTGPKRDFSQRASITNQDILAVYYGNPADGQPPSSRFPARRKFGSSRYNAETGPRSEKWRPRRSSRSPFRGRPGRPMTEFDLSRKGKKRWEKPGGEGTAEIKRFKRETQSDKLYLMHNSKATTEEKEKEPAPSASVPGGEIDKAKGKEESKATPSEPFNEDTEVKDAHPASEKDGHVEPNNALWDNDDNWTDSEDEGNRPGLDLNEGSTCDPKDEERDQGALPSVPLDDSKKNLGECSEDDEDAGWESLASDLDDQLDDVCVPQGLEAADAVPEILDNTGLVPTSPEAKALAENGTVGALSVVPSQDSEMADVDVNERIEDGKVVPDVDDDVKEDPTVEEERVGGEKMKVVIMEELQENGKIREDKAFDYYVSLFDQDTDLRKLYDANSDCSNYECLVCAGVGTKKKKIFPDVGSLVQHAKKILKTKKLSEHRGFARAVCNILGWEAVPGPSVILPRSCNIPEDSEPKALSNGASCNQSHEGTAIGLDWEWASARQLFEEQEARINFTSDSGVGTHSTSKADRDDGCEAIPGSASVDRMEPIKGTRVLSENGAISQPGSECSQLSKNMVILGENIGKTGSVFVMTDGKAAVGKGPIFEAIKDSEKSGVVAAGLLVNNITKLSGRAVSDFHVGSGRGVSAVQLDHEGKLQHGAWNRRGVSLDLQILESNPAGMVAKTTSSRNEAGSAAGSLTVKSHSGAGGTAFLEEAVQANESALYIPEKHCDASC